MPFLALSAVFYLLVQRCSDYYHVAVSPTDDISAYVTKITNEIKKINSRDASYTKAQKILSIKACRNNFGRFTADFTSINASVEALQNEMVHHYAVVRRIS
jgi:hypothetical protein